VNVSSENRVALLVGAASAGLATARLPRGTARSASSNAGVKSFLPKTADASSEEVDRANTINLRGVCTPRSGADTGSQTNGARSAAVP